MCYTRNMSDQPDVPADETPIQRALRMRKAAQARADRPNAGKSARSPEAGVAAGASRPWMKR